MRRVSWVCSLWFCSVEGQILCVFIFQGMYSVFGFFLAKTDLTEIQKTCLASQNTQTFTSCNRHYACMFLQSNHFLASSVRSSEKNPLPLHSRLQSGLLFHLASSISDLLFITTETIKVRGRRAHFNQTIGTRKNFSLILCLCLALCRRQDVKSL